jgi:hypothetical protein
LVSLVVGLAGCGGGSTSAAPAAVASPVSVGGQVTFDFVPAVAGQGLSYAATAARPARGVTVELLQNGAVTASTTTDATGQYSFGSVAANTDVSLRVRAELLRVGTPSWDFRVVDNVNADALYTLAGVVFNTGTVNVTRNLHAASGWGGASYTSTRSAAPFAILDTVYDAVHLILSAAPDTVFPALQLHWSTGNVPVVGTASGEIGSSRYRPGTGIFLVGAANQDTDQLDLRVAFGEAWGSAFAGMATGQEIYVDTHSAGQGRAFSFDLEQSPSRINPNPGWFNEESLQSLLFDLYDNGRDVPRGTSTVDDLALGFGPIWAVFTTEQRSTRALTSVFPFVNALKVARPADVPLIDQLTTSQRIATVTDDYGSGQTNFGLPTQRTHSEVAPDFHSVYDSLAVGATLAEVCSLDDYTSSLTDAENKLASRRFVRFTVANSGVHVITARALAPLNEAADPDMVLHLGNGQTIESSAAPASTCSVATPGECVETFSPTLQAGDYVLEVYEWSNTNRTDDATYPPIGRTCFDVTVTTQ